MEYQLRLVLLPINPLMHCTGIACQIFQLLSGMSQSDVDSVCCLFFYIMCGGVFQPADANMHSGVQSHMQVHIACLEKHQHCRQSPTNKRYKTNAVQTELRWWTMEYQLTNWNTKT